MGNKRNDRSWERSAPRTDFFDPFSGSAGVDKDFDDNRIDELSIIEKLRDRGHL